MSPEQYQQVQDEFLQLRDESTDVQRQRISVIRTSDPLVADEVELLLRTPFDEGFLSEPLVRIDVAPTTDVHDEPADPSALPQEKFGAYRLLQKIGEGGHGIVFMAEQLEPIRRRVAIKWIKPGMDSAMVLARFEAERQALAMMSHPSIANVLDASTTDAGQPYFVMELVHGVPIDDFCRANELSLDQRLSLFQQVCSAVHHAHQKGIIHRDIKPGNVLVTVESGEPLAKVIDFGIAKALHMPLTDRTLFTEYGQIVGTLEYMSPEQALMSQTGIDVRSDVYSLGVLLYLLLTGETPLSKQELLREGFWKLREVLQQIQPPTPSLRLTSNDRAGQWKDHAAQKDSTLGKQWMETVRGDLDWITMKALAKEPEMRYDSASEFAADIGHFLDGKPIVARPPSTVYNLKLWVRRHRVPTAVALTVALSVFIAFAGLVWGYRRSQVNLGTAKQMTHLMTEKATALDAALQETREQRDRADSNALRLAIRLEQDLLESAWESGLDGNKGEAQNLLQQIAPERRGAAWSLVETIAAQAALESLRHADRGMLQRMIIDQERGRLLALTSDSTLEIWDVGQRAMQREIELPGRNYSALGLSRDGRSVLVGATPDEVTLIDLGSGQALATRPLRTGGIRAIQADSRGQGWLVTTGANELHWLSRDALKSLDRIKLPERIEGIELEDEANEVYIFGLNGGVYPIGLSGDAAVGDNTTGDYQLELRAPIQNDYGEVLTARRAGDTWHAVTRDGSLIQWARGHANEKAATKRMWQLAAPPMSQAWLDPSTLIVFSREGRLELAAFDRKSPIVVRHLSQRVTRIAMLSEQLLALGTSEGTIQFFSMDEVRDAKLYSQMSSGLVDAATTDGGQTIVTAHRDGNLRRWNLDLVTRERELNAHQQEVFEIAISEAGDWLASVGADRKLVLSSAKTLEKRYEKEIDWGVRTAVFSRDGKVLATVPDRANRQGMREGTVDLWDIERGEVLSRLTGHENWVVEMAFDERDERLLTMSVDRTLRVWSVQSSTTLAELDLAGYAPATAVSWAPDGEHILIGHEDGSLTTWDLDQQKRVQQKMLAPDAIIGLYPVRPNSVVATCRGVPQLVLFDPNDGTIQAQLTSRVGRLQATRFHRPSGVLLLSGEEGMAERWDLKACLQP